MKRIYGPISSLGLLVRGCGTKTWVADDREAVVDLDNGTFFGAGPDDPVARLSWLGPADESVLRFSPKTSLPPGLVWVFRIGRDLSFRSKGITIGLEGPGRIESLRFHFGGREGFKPFLSGFVRNGQPVALSAEMTNADVRRLLGPPDVVEDYEDPCPNWPAYVYYKNGRAIRVEFGDDGILCEVSITHDLRYNPTQGLKRDPDVELAADFDTGTLCGVGIGESFKKLASLGAASDCTFIGCSMCDSDTGKCKDEPEDTIYSYKPLGLEVHCDKKGVINELGVRVGARENEPGNAFPGEIVLNGKRMTVDAFRTRADVDTLLGLPEWIPEGDPHSEGIGVQWYLHGNHTITATLGSGEKTEQIGWSRSVHVAQNPTKSWPRTSSLTLKADWYECSLCGVRLGEPLDRLSALGPANYVFARAEKTQIRRSKYRCDAGGVRTLYFLEYDLIVSIDIDRTIVAYELLVSHLLKERFQPGNVTLYRRGVELPKVGSFGTGRIEGIFGKPDRIKQRGWFGRRGTVASYVYEGADADRVISFDQNVTVKAITMVLKKV